MFSCIVFRENKALMLFSIVSSVMPIFYYTWDFPQHVSAARNAAAPADVNFSL